MNTGVCGYSNRMVDMGPSLNRFQRSVNGNEGPAEECGSVCVFNAFRQQWSSEAERKNTSEETKLKEKKSNPAFRNPLHPVTMKMRARNEANAANLKPFLD